jgi:hypothetical protein
MRSRGSWLLALALTGVALTACGDDDDDSATEATGTTAAAASSAGEEAAGADGASPAYCDALVSFNEAVFATEIDEQSSPEDVIAAGEQLSPLWSAVASNAPAAVSSPVATLTPSIEALLEGDASGFNGDATFETYTQLTGESVGLCQLPETAVVAQEYAFAMPSTVAAGTGAFRLTNDGAEDHEFVVFRKPPSETRTAEELLNDPALAEQGPGEFVTATFAPPGGESAALVELTPGEYVAVCFVPVGGTEDGPPHFTEGMFAEFTVE